MSETTEQTQESRAQSVYPKRRASQLSLEIGSCDEVTVVYCRGRIVYREEAAVLSEKIANLLPHTRNLVIELSGVAAIDSAGLGELVVVLMWVQASGCSMKLAAPRRHIRELLELTNLASVFEIHPTLEEAVLSCREQVA